MGDMPATGMCLVIMPFSSSHSDIYPADPWKKVYKGFLRPAVKAAGLNCHRDDEDFASRALRADRPCVIVKDELTNAPFDINDFNRFHYDQKLRPLALSEHIPRLAKMLTETLRDASKSHSVLGVLGIPSPSLVRRARPRCKVDVYYHQRGCTRADADRVYHPECEGGDASGYKIGDARALPAAVSKADLDRLLDPVQTNTSFQRVLWELTLSPPNQASQ